MTAAAALEKIKPLIGTEMGVSGWLTVDQERIDKFAECTEDFQWIHVDKEKSAAGPFGTTIAHGFLTLSLIPRLGSEVRLPMLEELDIVMGINYGLNRVRFIGPVPVDSRVRSRVTLKDAQQKGPDRLLLTYEHAIEVEGADKPACIAENLGMIVLG